MATSTVICEFCGAPIPRSQVLPMAHRLKYHAGCARDVDRLRSANSSPALDRRTIVCARPSCGATFYAKRRDAKFCSPRCRTAAHRA